MKRALIAIAMACAASLASAETRGTCPPSPAARVCPGTADRNAGTIYTCDDGTGLYLCQVAGWLELKFIPKAAPTTTRGSFSIDSLIVGAPAPGNVVQWNGSNWVPGAGGGGGLTHGEVMVRASLNF